MDIPSEYNRVMPYLVLENAESFAGFLEKVFDATLQKKTNRENSDTIMHAECKIGDITIMYCHSASAFPAQPGSFFIYVDNADESYALALKEGAVSVMGLSDQSYGRTCGVKDPCGNTWWITSV